MPLFNIPPSVTPELLYALARMGHGDSLTIADGNFPADSVAAHTPLREPIRITGCSTAELLRDVLTLLPLDTYCVDCVRVMDRVHSDKELRLEVPAYALLEAAVTATVTSPHNAVAVKSDTARSVLTYVPREDFYKQAKESFCIVQTSDMALYANVTIVKGVVTATRQT